MTYRDALAIFVSLVIAVIGLRILYSALKYGGSIVEITAHKPTMAPASTASTPTTHIAVIEETTSAESDRNTVKSPVEVIVGEDLTRPRMNYLWHILPDDPSQRELAFDRLERGWQYDISQQVGVRRGRYVVDGVPTIKPEKRSKRLLK